MSELEQALATDLVEPSLRDSVAAAFDEITAKGDDEATGDEQEVDAAEDVAASDAPNADADSGQDQSGADLAADESAGEEAGGAEEAAAGVAAPEHWSAADKDLFGKLPENARGDFLALYKRMETGANEKFTAAAEARRFHEEINTAVAPLLPPGVSSADAIKRLINAEQMLRTDPARGFQALLDQYGPGQFRVVRVGAEQPTAQPNGGGEPLTPDKVAELVERRFQAAAEEQQRQAAQIAYQRTGTAISEFADAKDDAGNPKFPHFNKVRVTMGALIQGQPGLTLEDAYNRAIWTDPALRDQLTAAQQAEAAKASAAQRRQSIDKARAAATPKTASRPVPPPPLEDMPLRDLVAHQVRELGVGEA